MTFNNLIINNSKDLEKKFKLIRDVPGLITVKDASLKFIIVTEQFLPLLGWKKVEQVIGKKDYDIPCKVSEIAERFSEIEERIIKESKIFTTLDICETSIGVKICLTKKFRY